EEVREVPPTGLANLEPLGFVLPRNPSGVEEHGPASFQARAESVAGVPSLNRFHQALLRGWQRGHLANWPSSSSICRRLCAMHSPHQSGTEARAGLLACSAAKRASRHATQLGPGSSSCRLACLGHRDLAGAGVRACAPSPTSPLLSPPEVSRS